MTTLKTTAEQRKHFLGILRPISTRSNEFADNILDDLEAMIAENERLRDIIAHAYHDEELGQMCSVCGYPNGEHRCETNQCPIGLESNQFANTVFDAIVVRKGQP